MPTETIAGEETNEKHIRLSLIIDKGQEPLRIDKFLMQRIEGATRNKIQQAIEEGHVYVNEKIIKSNYKLKPGDNLIVWENRNPNLMKLFRRKYRSTLYLKMNI